MDEIRDISISQTPPISTPIAKINGLPPEMLAAIFVYLSKQAPGHVAPYFVQDLISVTHVCRSWRQAAITAPELWSEVTMTNLEMIKVFLKRSGAVPLNVSLRLSSETEDDELFKAVVLHTHRFRRLLAFGHVGLIRTDVNLIPFTKPAPLLENLVIHFLMGNQPAVLFDDQTPRLHQLVLFSRGFWLQNHLGNLTSLSVTLFYNTWAHSDLLPFFDMLRRCPVLEEMYLSWSGWGPHLVPPKTPTVPLYSLRKLFLRSLRVDVIKYFLHTFDLRTNGTAVHLSGVDPSHEANSTISDIQTMFPNANPTQPSLVSSTKLELIFHSRPRTVILHAVGPGFSMRIDLCPDRFTSLNDVSYMFQNVFPSVKELWVRGSSRLDTKLVGIDHFTALEKLVIIGRGSKIARNFRQALSPDPSGVLPCPLLSTIDCHGDSSEMREVFLLLRTRSNAGRRLEKVRVPSDFIPLPADIASCVGDVGNLDIPPRILHMYAMELPEFCFSERVHQWWEPWKSRLN